jgi:subtilisin family serine protease
MLLLLLVSIPPSLSERVVVAFNNSHECQQHVVMFIASSASNSPATLGVHCSGRWMVVSGTDVALLIPALNSLISSSYPPGKPAVQFDSMVRGARLVQVSVTLDDEMLDAVDAYNTAAALHLHAEKAPIQGSAHVIPNPAGLEQWNRDFVLGRLEGEFGMDIEALEVLDEAGAKDHFDEIVAVLDSGVAASALPLFGRRLIQGYDFVSGLDISGDGDGRDPNPLDPGFDEEGRDGGPCGVPPWHGTYMMSVLGASRSANFSGLLPNARILSMRVIGHCLDGYMFDVAEAILWAVGLAVDGVKKINRHPAKVIVMSFSGRGQCPLFLQEAVDIAREHFGARLYAATGNEGGGGDGSSMASDFFPGNCRGVISVGALGRDGQVAMYSPDCADEYMPGGGDVMVDPVPCIGPYMQVGVFWSLR